MSQDPLFVNIGDGPVFKAITGSSIGSVLSAPQRLNSYSYSINNPLVFVDPTGLTPWEFITGKQSWDDFVVETGDAANYLYDNSPVWHIAMDHPIAAGAVVGVVGGGLAAGGAAGATALSTRFLGGAGTACLAFCGQVANGRSEQVLTSVYDTAVRNQAIRNNYNPATAPSRADIIKYFDQWENTTFGSKTESMVYHSQSKGENLGTLTDSAHNVWNSAVSNQQGLVQVYKNIPLGNGGQGIKIILNNGSGGIFTQNGKIISSWTH